MASLFSHNHSCSSGVPALHPLPIKPHSAFQGEQQRWVLLGANIHFQKGRWFRQRSSYCSPSKKRWADPWQGSSLLGDIWSSTVPLKWGCCWQPWGFSLSNADCYLNLSSIQNIPGRKRPNCQRNRFSAGTGNGGVGLAVDFSGHLSPAIICLRKRLTISSLSLDLVMDFSLLINVIISDRVLDSILLVWTMIKH